MLRRLLNCAAIALSATLFAAVVIPASAQKHQHQHHEHKRLEREQIVELEHEWQHAALTEDVATMDMLLSEDYLGITSNGQVITKAQQLDHMRNRKLILTKLQNSDVKIKLIGNIAIVTSLAQVEGTFDEETLHGAYRYTRVYQRVSPGVWKVTNFEITPTTRLHAQQTAQN